MLFCLLLLLRQTLQSHIYTWDLTLAYDVEGKLSSLSLPFKLTNALQPGAYLQLGGVSLHKILMSEVSCTISLQGVVMQTVTASTTTQISYTTHYYFPIIVPLLNSQWLIATIYPSSVASGFYYDPLILRTISSLDDYAMIYDANYAAAFLNVAELPPSGMTVSFSVNQTLYPQYQQPSASYVMTVNLNTRIKVLGVSIVLAIVQGSHTEGIGDDFSFISGGCSSTLSEYSCEISATKLSITSTLTLDTNQLTQISFGVQNPSFVSIRDLRVITIASSEGNKIVEKGFRSNVFEVKAVETITTGVEYLWGIDYLEDLTNSYVGVYAAENVAVATTPYNPLKVSFTVSASVNLIYPLVVRVKFGGAFALAGSTKHNFQSFDESTPVSCKYVSPNMECYNVGTLTSQTVYFISSRVLYTSTVSVDNFASVSFRLQQSLVASLLLYADSQGVIKTIDQDFNMLDIGGWHGPNGFLSYTQVSSIEGNTLQSNDLNKLFSSTGTVGIVVSDTDSSLLFFLKTTLSQICGASAVATDPCHSSVIQNRYLKMSILLNSQILTSNSFDTPSKLNYIANDGGGVYQEDTFLCVTGGKCDIEKQNSYGIYSGLNVPYGVAQFECGTVPGSATLLTDCFTLKGTTGTMGSNGILGLPKIAYASTFKHSSQYADETVIDFVVNFYRGSIVGGIKPSSYTRVSSHLINAYTVNAIQSPTVSFINYYMGPTKGNNGWRIPIMLRVKTPAQTELFDKIQVFFDSSVGVFNDQDYAGSANCYAYDVSSYAGPMDIWYQQNSVVCAGQSDIIFPILVSGLPKSIYVVLSKQSTTNTRIQSIPVKIYRVFGAAVNSEVRKIISPIGGLSVQGSDLVIPYYKSSQTMDMSIDVNSINKAKSKITFKTTSSSVDLEMNQNEYIGAGLTLVSIGQDIFGVAEIYSYFGQLKCFNSFYYYTNQLLTQDANAKLPRFVVFCPFDSQISYPFTGLTEVLFQWPQNFQLSTIITYAISGANGQLYAIRSDSGVVSRLLHICTLGKTNSIYPNSLGLQRIQFPIKFDSEIIIGTTPFSYASVQVIITIGSAITGFNIMTSTTICTIEGQSLNCVYAITGNVITVTLSHSGSGTIKINKNSVIIISFRIRATFGLSAFGNNQPFTIKIQLPSIDSTTSQKVVYGNQYDTPAQVQEECQYSQIQLETTALGKVFELSNIQIQVPNAYALSQISWNFKMSSYRDYVAADTSFIQFNIGFLRDQNTAANKLLCEIYDLDRNQLSTLFSKIDTSTHKIGVYLKSDLINPHLYNFKMICKNFNTPTNTFQTEAFYGALIDLSGFTQVQLSSIISYDSLTYYPQNGVIGTQVNAILLNKYLNSPGFGSIYQIQIQNSLLQMLKTFKINIRFHSGISTKKNRLGEISCSMDGIFCYCKQVDDLLVMDVCVLLQPLVTTVITLAQVDQPQSYFWPTIPTIFIIVDNDDDISNGIYFQTSITDIKGDDYQVQALEIVDTSISSNYIRTTQTHKLTINFPSSSLNLDNQLFIQFPDFYREQLEQTNSISCNLGRSDDLTKTNFASTCTLLGGYLIQMILLDDSANNLIKQYILTLQGIPMPQQEVPQDVLNNYRIRAHVVQAGYSRVKFTSAFYYSAPLSLVQEDKLGITYSSYLYKYNRDESIILYPQKQIQIYVGVLKTLIKVGNGNIFTQTFGYSINLNTFPEQLEAKSGQLSSDFVVGIKKNTIGYQIYHLDKTNGGGNYVSVLPDFQAFVLEEQCELKTDQIQYNLVMGGLTQPIYIDIQDCYPLSDLRIELLTERNELEVISKNPQNIIYESNVNSGLHFNKYQFIFQVYNNDANSLNIGDTLSMYFNISGVSSKYYTSPKNITLKIIDSDGEIPILTFNKPPLSYKNTITFYFTCTQSSTLLWVIGCNPDISYIPQPEIYNQTIYNNHMRTHRNTTDLDWKIYGAQSIINANDQVTEYFTALKSYADYTLLAFCIDSIGFVSEQLLYSWQTSYNGGSVIKLNVTFTRPLSIAQKLELVCALNQIFPIDPERIYDSQSYSCTLETQTLIKTVTSRRVLQSTTTSVYSSYFLYINPDQSVQTETINDEVQKWMSNLPTFKSTLQNNMNIDPDFDPLILQIQYNEPSQTTKPTLNYTTPIVTSTNITINFTLSLAQGYVGVGIEQTDTSPTPSLLQLRRSQNYLNRSLLQGDLLFFNYSTLVANETKQVVFANLSPNLKYKLYWFASNDDAGYLQKASAVTTYSVQTTPTQTYSASQIPQFLAILIIFIMC